MSDAPLSPRPPPALSDLPEAIREELWSIERLEQHAESLAESHRVRPQRRGDPRLTPRVWDNGKVLLESYRSIAAAIGDERAITPAAEWLVDNFHLVEEQLREIREDLPPGYYRQLPRLDNVDPAAFRGYPRVYALAYDFVAHTDSRFDEEALTRFVRAYQRRVPLTIGELWALAISLRVVLVENLRRMAERMVRARAARERADDLADALLADDRPAEPAALLRRYEDGPRDAAFTVVLLGRLRDQDPQVTPALAWLDQRLARLGVTADEAVAMEHHRQGAANATVRNVITSMRAITAFDWQQFFEQVSAVHATLATLATVPGFLAMDFATRDRYRRAIEDLARGARHSGHSEVAIAERVVALARSAAEDGAGPPRAADLGYHLISAGRPAFERAIGYRKPLRSAFARAFVAGATPSFLGLLAAATVLSVAVPLAVEIHRGTAGWLLVVLGLLALLPASDLAVQGVNALVMKIFGPRLLPRLELAAGVPAYLRTLVAVPTMLAKAEDVEEQVARLEVHYLANPEAELRFALLSDWLDAPAESMPGDDAPWRAATAAIAHLNELYGPAPGGSDRFLLLHRRRVWSASEGCWLGWERKRGKLEELNRLLRGDGDTTFLATDQTRGLAAQNIRYVLTLDADTRLPRESARKLIGTLAHPLNQPAFDAALGRVTSGYGVLQPRIAPSLPTGSGGSLFERVFSGPAGIDPYAAAVSDVYQDLFGEGSFTGKGIYDVDAFRAALAGRVPESSLLSHDLFEGIFARTGLVTDVELFEEFPSHFAAAAYRQHRWARGDWQLLPWIFGRGPRRAKLSRPPRPKIPTIGRFKMLDNLRRTLSAPAAFLTLLAGWTLPGVSPATWTLFVLGTMALPACLRALAGLIPRRRGISKRSHLQAVGADFGLAAAQIGLAVTFLAYQAWQMSDAIVRTLARLYVTRRHLLEWVTAAQAKTGLDLDLAPFYRRMDGGVLFGVLAGLGAGLGAGAGPGWAWAAPAVLLWLAAPAVARWISLTPGPTTAVPPAPADAAAFRLIARRTWRFFETFVTAEDRALPPDNFQEDPRPVVAHRTSPTNLGLYLLSVVAARDFGWLGTVDAARRLGDTLDTMLALPRCRGHFYNWYDTRSGQALEPRYVSTVDSGNLAAHLVALAESCRQLAVRPLFDAQTLAGIADAVALVRESAPASAGQRTQTVTRRQLDEALDALTPALRVPDAGSSAEGARTKEPRRAQPSLPTTPAEWAARLAELDRGFGAVVDIARALASEQGKGDDAAAWNEVLAWAELGAAGVRSHLKDVAALAPDSLASGSLTPPEELAGRLHELARTASDLFSAMEFGFLYDTPRKLLSIGYRVAENQLDANDYDLLASEARLASFIAIAKGDVPVTHWFHLGRSLTPVANGSALISWSGSMFEYLMPDLVLSSPAHSLLDQTCRMVVARQIQYGEERGVPWGVSESAFNARDLELTYQYSNFGVPGLGLKRGLSEDVVVAPYATALAAMFAPREAGRNFVRLTRAGARGVYGFYEAVDYTASRLPEGRPLAVVRAYMAHHQGMALLALAVALDVQGDGGMPARFHADPIVRATELLLQERTPRGVAVARPRAEEVAAAARIGALEAPVARRYRSPHSAVPKSHLLSNGRYSVMLTAAGAGYSRYRDLAVTRFRADRTRDAWGSFLYCRDVATGAVWSAGFQPSGAVADDYAASFAEDRAEIVRRDRAITTRLEVVVSPEDDGEVRQLSLTNHGAPGTPAREIEITSYAEVVLASPAADLAHPAFSNLFVETELLPSGALLASRRPRSREEPRIWAVHVTALAAESAESAPGMPGVPAMPGIGGVQYETDRLRFLGRGRGVRTPLSVIDGRPLSNTAGAVLDPIFSLRRRVRLAPGATARVVFSTLVAPSREAALALADKYRDPAVFERAANLAWTQAQVQLRHLGIQPDEANLFQRLANRVLYSDPSLRAAPEILLRNGRGASALWAHGLSGDLPIVLVRIDELDDLGIIRQLLKAHEYFRLKLLAVDLVILNERASSYVQDLQSALEALVRTRLARHGGEAHEHDSKAHVFILRADQVTAESRAALFTAARAVLTARRGTLAEQMVRVDRGDRNERSDLRDRVERSDRGDRSEERRPAAALSPAESAETATAGATAPRPELEFWNGLGGFAGDGREYVTVLGEGQSTPAPWLNVIANPHFGFQVSESGAGYTWSGNSRENQLTPWSNDPVSDPPGEVLYVRDDDSGHLWGPTVLPIRDAETFYVARHGQGYSRFEHRAHGVTLELLQFVPLADPVKISRLTIENHDARTRRLSVTAYVEWVLGSARTTTAPYIVTELDAESRVLLARNAWNEECAHCVAFADLRGRQTSWSGDRTEILGRNGSLDHPAALERGDRLSGRVGAGLDPCGALQTSIELRPGAKVEIVFLLGQADGLAAVRALVQRYRQADLDAVLAEVVRHWEDIAGALAVRTPDRAMDLLLNRWLLYQTLSCRVWARSAFYQAGGAFGFRDQLQDVLALTVSRREVAREHILRAAARQFTEGDVQHWWHPPTGRGVRTHISDDLLWLPFAVLHYVEVTGEQELLAETVPFLDGPLLGPEEEDAYYAPAVSGDRASLFEHCARALDARLAVGRHGLPLIGTGDWNDGMNRVGRQGQGESVWMGWFLHPLLVAFARLAEARGESVRATAWRAHAGQLKAALEGEAWDGNWYRRAYFDDGTPLGSAANTECRIDSIAQSWAVLSGAADPARAARAMAAVEEFLVRPGDGLVLLFTPPFDQGTLDPGYIQGYLPGVRENGGQYTHAAIWSLLAFAAQGDGDRAGELFALLNPIHHAGTRAGIHRYKVEPYVMAADIYAEPTHLGRGGWTWYTGSAAWMYRAGIEGILGFRLRGAVLHLQPAIPRAWPSYEMTFRYHAAEYTIEVANPRGVSGGVTAVEVDGVALPLPAGGGAEIGLVQQGKHRVEVVLG